MKPINSLIAFVAVIISAIQCRAQNCLPSIAHDSLQLVTDGVIRSSASFGDTVFVGGTFSYIGSYTGGYMPVDTLGNNLSKNDRPIVHGAVFKMVPDGHNGFFIGGRFNKVGDSLRNNFAHIDHSGNVTAYKIDFLNDTSTTQASVRDMHLRNGKLYVAGKFTLVNNRVRNNAVCIDMATGGVTSWSPDVNNLVNQLAFYGDKIYMCGAFTAHGYSVLPAKYLIAVDSSYGDTVLWNPLADYDVYDMCIDGDRLYVGGSFRYMGIWPRVRVACFDLLTGGLYNWTAGLVESSFNNVNSLCVLGNRLYIGGGFSKAIPNGPTYVNLMAVDKYTGVTKDFNVTISTVNKVRPYKNKLYVSMTSSDEVSAGAFGLQDMVRKGFAAYDTLGVMRDWKANSFHLYGPLPSGSSRIGYLGLADFLFYKDTIYLMGNINSVGGILRKGFAAFNGKTGEILPIDISANTNRIEVLQRNDSMLYIGGEFSGLTYKNTTRYRYNIAAYNIKGDSLSIWNANYPFTSPRVYAIETAGNTIAVGSFCCGNYGGYRLFDIIPSGQPTVFSNSHFVYTIKENKDNFFVGGSIGIISAQQRNGLALVDRGGNLLPWNINAKPFMQVNDLEVNGPYIYIASDSGVVRADTVHTNTSPLSTTWNPVKSVSINSILFYNGKMYAGGENYFGTAIDTFINAAPSKMNLGIESDSYEGNRILSLLNIDSTLYAFGTFRSINNGQKRISRIVRFNNTAQLKTGYAKVVAPDIICNATNTPQLWSVNTNMENPTYTWYRNGVLINTDTTSPGAMLQVQNGDKIFCTVQVGSGCYGMLSVNSDTVTVVTAQAIDPKANLKGPSAVCYAPESKYVMSVNAQHVEYRWTFNNTPLNNNSDTLLLNPPGIGVVKCSFNILDKECYTSYSGYDTVLITSVTTQIAPAVKIAPNTLSDICVSDSAILKLNSNIVWGKFEWKLNGNTIAQNVDSVVIFPINNLDVITCSAVADTPNCFSVQTKSDTLVANPQQKVIPTISVNGPTSVALGGNVVVTANVNNAGSTYSIDWYNNGVFLSTTTTPQLSYIKSAGLDVITAVIKPEGCYDTAWSNTQNIWVVGINDVTQHGTVNVYPNPFNTSIVITGVEKGDHVIMYNVLSQKVFETTNTSDENTVMLEPGNLPQGSYIMTVTSADGAAKKHVKLQKK